MPSQERCHTTVDVWWRSVMLHKNANCECKRWPNIIATFLLWSRLASWCVEGNKWSTDYLEYDIRKVLSCFLHWCFINLACLFLFYQKFSQSFTPFAVTLYYLNIRPESSETESITSTACLQSGAKDLLRNSFRLHQHTISFISGGLRSSPENPFLEFCRAVLSPPSAWPEYQHSDSLSMLVSFPE
jgi:hypothetical protein